MCARSSTDQPSIRSLSKSPTQQAQNQIIISQAHCYFCCCAAITHATASPNKASLHQCSSDELRLWTQNAQVPLPHHMNYVMSPITITTVTASTIAPYTIAANAFVISTSPKVPLLTKLTMQCLLSPSMIITANTIVPISNQ